MDNEKERTWLQCTKCGHIYIADYYVSMENAIIDSYCERCGHNRALNCGYSEDDAKELQDYFLYY